MKKATAILFYILLINSCNHSEKKRFDEIYLRIQENNLTSIIMAEENSMVDLTNNTFERGDSLIFQDWSYAYLFGNDSTKAKVGKIDSTSILIYQYKFGNNYCVFSIYDKQGYFLDKGILSEEELRSAVNGDLLLKSRSDFYRKYIIEREKGYKLIEEEFSISRDQIDSLVAMKRSIR